MENRPIIRSVLGFAYWNIVFKKLIETFISVKLWIIAIATFFAFKMINIYAEIKDVILLLAVSPHQQIDTTSMISVLANWSRSLLDVSLAMFTGVIVVIALSREVFKHAKLEEFNYDNEDDNIKNRMV